jgi:hypothetical protein
MLVCLDPIPSQFLNACTEHHIVVLGCKSSEDLYAIADNIGCEVVEDIMEVQDVVCEGAQPEVRKGMCLRLVERNMWLFDDGNMSLDGLHFCPPFSEPTNTLIVWLTPVYAEIEGHDSTMWTYLKSSERETSSSMSGMDSDSHSTITISATTIAGLASCMDRFSRCLFRLNSVMCGGGVMLGAGMFELMCYMHIEHMISVICSHDSCECLTNITEVDPSVDMVQLVPTLKKLKSELILFAVTVQRSNGVSYQDALNNWERCKHMLKEKLKIQCVLKAFTALSMQEKLLIQCPIILTFEDMNDTFSFGCHHPVFDSLEIKQQATLHAINAVNIVIRSLLL